MDFITGLPKVNGKDCIFVVVDRLTKYTHFFTIPSDFQAAQVADQFLEKSFVSTGYLETLSVIRMGNSLVSSRHNCFR